MTVEPKTPPKFFWGKLKAGPGNEATCALPLKDHCLDVATVFRQLTVLPAFQRSLTAAAGTRLTPPQLDRLAVLALLHDFGKANLGFQRKPFHPKALRVGHIFEIAPLLNTEQLANQLAQSLDWGELMSWFNEQETLEAYFFTILSHHGRPIHKDGVSTRAQNCHQAKKQWWQSDGQHDPFQALSELMTLARQAFPAAFTKDPPPLPDSPRLQHRFAGLLMLADWLGSDDRFFPIDNGRADRRQLAPTAAARILRAVGLDIQSHQQTLQQQSWPFEPLFGFPPHPLQQALDQLPTEDPAHRLLIAEAETGSGKTEAALIRFFRLFAAGAVDGLYFALPTRVAARELYQRVDQSVKKAFPDPASRPLTLLAVPGYTRVDGNEASLLPDRTTRCSDEPALQRRERHWAAEHPKRFLAATIAVGTIDQALLSAVQSPHAHLRSICLDRQLLVVDEVHASDPYMRHLLAELLRHHLARSHALLLSATLGAVAREIFIATTGAEQAATPLSEAIAAPYPALTDGRGTRHPLAATDSRPKQIRIECEPHLDDPTALLPAIQQALAEGARILVVLNTVGRALTLQRAAEKIIPAEALFRCHNIVTPHHGHYSPADRELLDGAVSRRLGKGSPPGPLLLIGTQTLEQSLDIDADLLISDLCPMDVLLQRIGRLHRHKRERPTGMRNARCLLLVPETDRLDAWIQNDGEATDSAKRIGLGSVYPDLRTLQLTWDYLRQHPHIEIPRDNRRLVESTTHPEALAQLQSLRWDRHTQAQISSLIVQEDKADGISIVSCYAKPFGTFAFPEKMEKKVSTRLGLDTLRLLLPMPINSPFGIQIAEIIIPGHMVAKNLKEEAITDLQPTEDGFKFCLGPKHYHYSHYGLEILDESTN